MRMKRLLVLVGAMVFVCLMMSACKAGIEVEQTETPPPATDEPKTDESKTDDPGMQPGETDVPGGDSLAGDRPADGQQGSVPNTENGFQKMKLHKKQEETMDTCYVHLTGEGEDNKEAWKTIEKSSHFKRKKKVAEADNAEIHISPDRINRDYLAWLKEDDPDRYRDIRRNGFLNARITVVGSDDFDRICMMYDTCSETDDIDYKGEYSVYNYKAGETVPVERTEIVLDGGEGEEIGSDRFTLEIAEVGYGCPWYLNRKTDTSGIRIGVSMKLFEEYFEGQGESFYVVQAQKGELEELKEDVYQQFPNAWITGGGVYYQ